MKLAAVVVIPLAIWMVGLEVRVSNMDLRLSTIEKNRFTDKDAADMERRIMAALPPSWLREDLKEIKTLLRDYEARLRAIEAKVK